jgi:3-hydroxyisobutyrate dehydrogenase
MSSKQPPGTVGVIGIGVMGSRVAAALAEAGLNVIGHDIDPVARERAEALGVRVVAGAKEVLAQVPVVLLSLPMPADVLAVVEESLPAAEGVLVIDLSTIDPGTAREAAARVRGAGGRYVDAPVLGRPASVGAWTLPAGGQDADVAEVSQLTVGTIAKAVLPVGDVGAGCLVKVLNNMMFGAINAVTAEVLDLADRWGLPPARFVEVVADSGAATVSPLFRDVAPRMAAHDHTPVFSLALLRKDVGLGITLAQQLDAPAEISTAVAELTNAAVGLGHGQDDTSALIELYDIRRDQR